MTPKITRRQFLKMGAVAGAVTVLSGCTLNLQQPAYLEAYVRAPEDALPGEDTWYASTCRQCPAGCGIVVRVSNGRARKIEGNPQHPLNRGKLCARGQAGLQVLYNPDRLRNAVRQSGRGSRNFQPIDWEDAVKELAEKLAAVRDPAGIAFLAGQMPDHLAVMVRRFLQALGAPAPVVYDLGSALEGRAALSQVSAKLFGAAALPIFDIGASEVVFSFGADFLETWLSPVAYGRALGRIRGGPRGQRGYLVYFGPRYSMTAASADEWIPVRPGAEGLVALGIGKVIVEEGLGHDLSHREHAALYQNVRLAEVAEASGVAADELRRLARLFADAHHQVALPGGALAAQPDGGAALEAVQSLNATMFHLGEHGGVFLTPAPAAEGFAPSSYSTFAEAQSLIQRMQAEQVKVLFVYGTNPLFELPAAAGFAAALNHVPLVVSFGSFVDETAVQADLILPDPTYLESWGYHIVSPGADRPVVSAQQPVVRPLYDTRATADVLLALAHALKGAAAQALPWQNEIAFLKETIPQLRDVGVSADAFWTAWRQRGGWWPAGEQWNAPVATAALNAPLTVAAPTFDGSAQEFPFYLHLYPSIALGDGRGANQPWLQETADPMTTVAWNTWVEVNPQTAAKLGIKDDDVVTVTSPYGAIEAAVYVYRGLRGDVIAIPVGQGHTDYGRYAQSRGRNPLDLLAPRADATTGALTWSATRVRLTSTGRKRTLARLESSAGIEHAAGESAK